MRRQFELGEEDIDGLAARGFTWETIIEAKTKWLIVNDYPIPDGYNHRKASVALRIPPSYPDDQIDMAYFFPALALVSGKQIIKVTAHSLDGKEFQQWSRHRTEANPWRKGLDSICTHLLQVDSWMERALRN
jgi:hypothetical protein